MLPSPKDLMFCIMRDGQIVDGAHGLAIGPTEFDAWRRAVEPAEDWAISHARKHGDVVRRCAIQVVNP